MLGCFGCGSTQVKEKIYPFTNLVLQVDKTGGWEGTVAKVLKKIKGEVSSLRMYEDGTVQIAGTMDPVLFLKVLAKTGKGATLVDAKSGGCSRNLHMPEIEQHQQYKKHLQYQAAAAAFYTANFYKQQQIRGNYNNYGARGQERRYATGNVQYLPHQPAIPW